MNTVEQDRHLNLWIVTSLTIIALSILAAVLFSNADATTKNSLTMVLSAITAGMVGFMSRGNAKRDTATNTSVQVDDVPPTEAK